MTETTPDLKAEAASAIAAVMATIGTPVYEALVRDRGGRPPGTPAPRQEGPPLALERLQSAHRPPTPPWVTDGGRKPRSGARRTRETA
jgi:hypothetical protein